MKLYADDNDDVEWPDDWPKPTKGANMSPLMSAERFEATKRDIKANGLYDKIHFTPDREISKGRSRYRALREIGWSHERIVEEASITVKSSDASDTMSNILRVHRSTPALIASYMLANPEALKKLLVDRENGTKSGSAKKVAAVIGCSAMTISRFLDRLTGLLEDERDPMTIDDAVDYLTTETEADHDAMLALLAKSAEKKKGGASISDVKLASSPPEQHEDRRVRVTPEKKEQIEKAHAEGKSKSEIAREVNVSRTAVQNVLKAEPEPVATEVKPKPQPKSEADPINKWIAKLWKAYKDKTVTPDLFKRFISDALEAPATKSVVSDALEAFKFE